MIAMLRAVVVAGVLAAALVVGCGREPLGCRAACADFKALPDSWCYTVDCSAPEWGAAKTCDECKAVLGKKCAVSSAGDCFCQQYFGDACEQ
jgi:hypothetical protein